MQDFAREMRKQGMQRARAMRDQARETALKRKEEYLGARVPRELREKVIARADELGIPVSILIRNILEQAFSGGQPARDEDPGRSPAPERARTAPAAGFPGVIAWEQIVLNRNMQCASCGREVAAGARATLGLPVPGEVHVVLCGGCRPA